ncbi:hypothetical protein AVEN_196106-1 [Araneus ventricosus]|uniref:Reverse transcriptase domain-containing protein n=1 Tax=Araneus ventricosus TaxID=182803 RepID=A0A4Y2HKE9_ARAVE|nr:hypothetical protein AVEN_196106-1 [Araneus ventricosus]
MVQQLVLKNFVDQLVKKIKSCEELPVGPFSSINVENMPDNIDRMVLNSDQQYLYDICLEMSRGECYSNLALRKPDPVGRSRWLTTADIQGAFDHLQYNSTRNSLDEINFPSHTIETLKDILTDRKVTIQTAQGPASWSQQQGCAEG